MVAEVTCVWPLVIATATVGSTTSAMAPVTIGTCGSAQREPGTLCVYAVALLGKEDVDPAAYFFFEQGRCLYSQRLPCGTGNMTKCPMPAQARTASIFFDTKLKTVVSRQLIRISGARIHLSSIICLALAWEQVTVFSKALLF